MCGICGKYSPDQLTEAELKRMLQAISHRGPDDAGTYLKGPVGLGNRRLSIIDLPGGHQPVANEAGTVWVVYNGEIYNYRQLRQELAQKGHHFRSQSDTEVIVHLYEELGERCVERLNGMFAFALWDESRQKLLLARDRLGQKPLFYAQIGPDFLFASEVKAILAAGQRAAELDVEAMHHYLSLRFIPPPLTMVRHVRKLPPAHTLVFQNGTVTISRYWDLSFADKFSRSESELIETLEEKLGQAVRTHLVSDVPVGAFLSGGMDSSMIVALMSHANDGSEFKTFAIGVEAQDFNELPYARQVADHYQTCHVERCVQPNIVELLPKMIWHLDEPSDPIAACQFYAAELAARHVKVVLGGDGGDELFAGFDRYLGLAYIDRYRLIPSLIRQRLLGPVLDRLPDSFAYKSLTQKLRWVHQLSALSSPGEQYAEATCFFRFNRADKQQLYGDDLWRQVGSLNSAGVITRHFDQAQASDWLDRMLYADFITRLPEHSLMLTDRMTMAHSLEARSPFLDHELVEFMAAFPNELKIRGRELKYVLRKLAVNYLPQAIVARQKQGFMFPVAYWFRNELYPFIKQILLNSYFVEAGLFRREAVLRLIEDHRHSRVDNHVRLWMLLNLELWRQLYIEQHDIATVAAKIGAYCP